MASTDAKPIPQKNVAHRITFPIYDADGDLVTGATGLDSEVSKDGGTFADCTNEATEIATNSGIYYLDLTSTEMNADTVAVIIKTSTSGAKTTAIVMYPEEAGDIRVNVTQFGGSNGTFSSGRPEVNTTHAAGTAWGSGAITAASIASDAITAAKVASDVTTEIQSGLATASALSTVEGKIDTIDDFLDTEVAAILADTNELQTDLANGGRLDLLIDAIKAKTDNLPADPADDSDIDTQLAAIKAIADKLDDTLEDDGGTYRFTENALEEAPSGGASAADIADAVWDEDLTTHTDPDSAGEALGNVSAGASPSQIADAVWDEKIDDHLSDRSFGMKVGIHLPFVSPDIDYKKISSIVSEKIDSLPKPKDADLEPISVGLQALLEEIRAIPTPDKPEKADYSPILSKLEAIERTVKAIDIPQPEETDLSPVLEKLDEFTSVMDSLDSHTKSIAEESLNRIRQLFSSDLAKISEDVNELKDQFEGIPFLPLGLQKKEKPEKKTSAIDEYLNLPK